MGLLDFLSSLGPDELAAKRKAMMQSKLDAAGNAAQGLLAPTTGTFTEGLTRALPLTGEAWTANDAGNAAKEGNYGQAAALGLLGLLPMGGMMAAGLKAGVKVPSRMGQSGAIAWHGSPHKFDKFSLDKIGTGEGAQAYGHGLYLAETPDVAKAYQEKLSPGVAGVPLDAAKFAASKNLNMQDYNKAAKILVDSNMDLSKAIKEMNARNANLASLRIKQPDLKLRAPLTENTLRDVFENIKPNNGNLYKTDIPDEAVARFLDWDKPIAMQEPHIKKAIKAALDKSGSRSNLHPDDFYSVSELKNHLGFGDMSRGAEALRNAGIPGIRYLDGGSRSGGAGTSNFVAFDPELIRILERNGIPTGNQPWKAGEWQGLLGGAK